MSGVPETFGKRLRRLRMARMSQYPVARKKRQHGPWTLSWLGNRLGFADGATVWFWETDQRFPAPHMLTALAALFEVSEHYLRFGSEDPRLDALLAEVEELRAALARQS